MIYKSKKKLLIKNNLKLILDAMIPANSNMPNFTKAVKVNTIIKKLNNGFLNKLEKKLNLNNKKNWDSYIKVLGNDILESYFTSDLVIKALNQRKKKCLKNLKKENMIKLLTRVKYSKKKFIYA